MIPPAPVVTVLVHTVAGDRKGNALYLAVLAGLDDFGTAVADLDVQIALYGIVHRLRIGDGILQLSVRPYTPSVQVITPRRCEFFFLAVIVTVSAGAVSAVMVSLFPFTENESRNTCGKQVIGKDIVCIGKCGSVLFAVPCKLDILRFSCGFGKEARHFGMLLYACRQWNRSSS